MPVHPYLEAPLPLAFAHRGGAAMGDENTAAAFERAIKLGFRYVETDVHATADGIPVVFHDTTLHRLTGERGRIDALKWADLRTLRVAGEAAVPRLDETLETWPEIRFNVDVKATAAAAPTVATVKRSKAFDRVLLASFSDSRLALIRRLAGPSSGLATSLGMRSIAWLRTASLAGARVRFPESVVAAQVPVRHAGVRVVDRRFLRTAHRAGIQVHVWTIDDPAEMRRLLEMGVDGVMTDRPEVLREVLSSRSEWAAP